MSINADNAALVRDLIKVTESSHECAEDLRHTDAALEVAVVSLVEAAQSFAEREDIPASMSMAVMHRLLIEWGTIYYKETSQ